MNDENKTKSHPNSIWYWCSGEKLWYLPYSGTPKRTSKSVWTVSGSFGQLDIDLYKTSHILFYGANETTGDLPLLFLSDCAKHSVSISIHRNHVSEPFVFYRNKTTDRDDLVTAQILHRENTKKSAYIARTIIRLQIKQRGYVIPSSFDDTKLLSSRNVDEVRTIEATASREYWRLYFKKLGLEGLGRRDDHVVVKALDATSHFLSGIMLRWVLSHELSPAHGFIHKSSSYPSLVYDLIEPLRWIPELAVFQSYLEFGEHRLLERSIERFKQMLDEPIHSEPTRQLVYRRTLIHGQVIALRHYLNGNMQRYLPPVEELAKERGRKRAVSYTLPGQIWKK
ncbi:hypothetical protein A3715_16890 [Oleiphilus sp. HI0009]|nr:hypothetical protein A3715_16890 [Oleiphilus sp. HI0009]